MSENQVTERTPMVSVPLEDNGTVQGSPPPSSSAHKIIVRTVSGRRAQDPNQPSKKLVVFRCNWLCRRLGIRRFPPPGCWFVLDICGVISAAFTWLLLLYAECVVSLVILPTSESAAFNWIAGGVFHALVGLAFLSHCKAMFSDPGAVPLGDATEENIRRVGLSADGGDRVVYKCGKCSSIKPERSHHCSVCRRCIRKMDHHCPWVNNCVGEFNQKYFVLFTFYICISSFFAIYMTIHHFIMCSDWEICRPILSEPVSVVLMVLLIFEGIMFGIFTAIMFGDQMHGILKDQTNIETLKRERPNWKRASRWALLEGVFGRPFTWRWFSPFSPPAVLRYSGGCDSCEKVCLYSV